MQVNEDGLWVIEPDGPNPVDPPDAPYAVDLDDDSDLESLRDEFVEGFNGRDLDGVLAITSPDVEVPDLSGGGPAALAEELESIWERFPGVIMTRGFLDGRACAVVWLPDDDGCWRRAAVVCFDGEDTLLTLVMLPDDADALDRAEAEEPTGEELDEWDDWGEWERGEETIAPDPHRPRP